MNSLRSTGRITLLLLVMAACRSKESTGPTAVPASIEKIRGDAQTGTVGATLPTSLGVRVLDESGNPVNNARIQWEPAAGAGSVNPTVSFTNAEGAATTQWTLGPVAGTARATAQVGGVSPVVFSVTALPGAVAQVVSLPDVMTLNVGQSILVRSSVRDQFGNDVVGQAITYSTPDATVVSVASSGLVTALTIGNAKVIATAGEHADTVVTTVLAAGTSPCGTTTPAALAVGEVFNPASSGSSTRVCLTAPDNQSADFGMVLVSAAPAFTSTLVADLYGVGISSPMSANVATRQHLAQSDLPFTHQMQLSMDGPLILDRGAEQRRRALERRELTGLRGIARERFTAHGDFAASAQPRVVSVGDMLTLNSNALSACESPNSRTGRVTAVGSKSIIVADNENPPDGYTDAEYASIAATFDTLIYPMGVEAFGAPTDVSGYGKIILFYTRAVNALTPANSGFVIGGFFFARDLYPKTARSGLPACGSSNEAEMFYLLVPDPSGTINSNRRSKEQVSQLNIGTIAHEFQHLINSSRRLYINAGAVQAEETWLDEGMSHIAEELLYFRLAGYSSRQNLDVQDVAGNAARTSTFSSYGIQNFGRFYEYLRNPEMNSPYAQNDSLATRGAIWNFLRFAAAREGAGGEDDFFKRIVNSTSAGLTNLTSAIPSSQIPEYLRDWSLSLLADDYSAEVMEELQAQYINPAWNFRSIYPALRIGGQTLNVYPLSTRSLFNNTPQRINLPGGATSYIRFSVPAGESGVVSLSSNGGALPSTARVGVVRLR